MMKHINRVWHQQIGTVLPLEASKPQQAKTLIQFGENDTTTLFVSIAWFGTTTCIMLIEVLT